MKTNDPLVIYHANCRDGWCAAYLAKKAFPDAELWPAQYGDAPPLFKAEGREVLMVDFSYSRAEVEGLNAVAAKLVVLDHHKSAAANLEGLDYCTFDMSRSGAGMTWDFLHPGQMRPWFVAYVEDRDLWRHALPNSHLVNAWLSLLTFTVEEWDQLEFLVPNQLLGIGAAVVRKTQQYVEQVAKQAIVREFPPPYSHSPEIRPSYMVPVVNAAYHDVSELGHYLCKTHPDAPFAVVWWQRADGLYQYSLRSKGSFDVAEVAEYFGGGGHLNAAGFETKERV
jgi:oligoribonuclease NrnB/cAMP/cGMP phosphodiesterase (DHH superfamily)